MMRSLCTYLAGVVLAGPLLVFAPGCGGVPETAQRPEGKKLDPMTELPGTKLMQDNFNKKGGNTRK
jgi:hypothetical protein